MCWTPLQSLSPPPRCPTSWPGLTSLESFDLFNGILARAPCGRLVHVRPVPPSGFLNLSAVSQQARVPRPCFVPQPFLGPPLQSLPLAGIASPLSGSLAPLRSSTGVPRAPKSRRSPRGFRRRPRPRAVADFPLGPRSSFQTPRGGSFPIASSDGPWAALSACFTRFGALLLLRIRCAAPAVKRTQRPLLSWGSSPPEFLDRASDPRPAPDLAVGNATHARRRPRATRRTSSPPSQVGPKKR